ncbi:hypothetical protein [Jatrophihabitans fulvus]
MIRKTLTALALGGAAAATVVAAAPAAQAATLPPGVSVPGAYYYVEPCAGRVIAKTALHNDGKVKGSLVIRYSGALGGTVCAQTYDNTAGKHRMTVALKRRDLPNIGSDVGTYDKYAGGIAVPRSNGRCFVALGINRVGATSYAGYLTFCNPGRL